MVLEYVHEYVHVARSLPVWPDVQAQIEACQPRATSHVDGTQVTNTYGDAHARRPTNESERP